MRQQQENLCRKYFPTNCFKSLIKIHFTLGRAKGWRKPTGLWVKMDSLNRYLCPLSSSRGRFINQSSFRGSCLCSWREASCDAQDTKTFPQGSVGCRLIHIKWCKVYVVLFWQDSRPPGLKLVSPFPIPVLYLACLSCLFNISFRQMAHGLQMEEIARFKRKKAEAQLTKKK